MPVRPVFVAALIAAAADAQAPASASATSPCPAVALLYEHVDAAGERLPRDVADVLAAVRFARGKAAAPKAQASLHVDDACTCLSVAARDPAQLAAFVAACDDLSGSDDELALAAAAAALQADDERHLLPGGAHAAAARAALWPSAPQRAGAEALAALTPASLRALATVARYTAATGNGAIDAALAHALATRQRLDLPMAINLAGPAPGAGDELVSELHPRVDQPFVALAFAVPADLDRAALAVALAIARERAAALWPLRGSELRARTPYVAWSWLHDERVVTVHRRGFAPIAVRPGERCADAAAECEATVAEVRALLAELQRPFAAGEMVAGRDRAAAELGLRLALDVADPASAALALRQQMVRYRHGIDAAALAAVDAAAATAALQRVLAAPRQWHALLPSPSPAKGWRPR